MKPYYDHEGITIYLGDCREILPHLEPVDLVLTSPPYWNQRSYGPADEWISNVPVALSKVPDNDFTQVICNLGLIHREGEVFCYWEHLISEMKASGWRLFGWYVWDQGDGLPGDWNGRFAPAHEFIFHFNKKQISPLKWIRTQQRKASGAGLRGKDNKTKGKSSPDKCGQEYKISDSVIRVYRQMKRNGLESDHPAVFPITFANHLIQSIPGQTILDPFMGSGTTLVACKQLGRRGIGIEIERKYCDIAIERLRQEVLPL